MSFVPVGGASIAVLAVADVQSVWAVLLPQCLFVFGHSMHQPCGQAGAGLLLAGIAFAIGRWLV